MCKPRIDAYEHKKPLKTRQVRTFLRKEGVYDLYREGMTIEEAEDASMRDPRVIERHVRTFLRINDFENLYHKRMTMEEAKKSFEARPTRPRDEAGPHSLTGAVP
jgi:hypothetical protein